jgi:RNA polymerase sigma factor (sigma-70 family)
MSNEDLVQLIKQGIDSPENTGLLYTQNKGIIYAIVKKYRYACQSDYNSTPIIEMDELMHEAYFGLVKAVESYDADQGVLFMSYASHWIGQDVKRYLDNCGRVIRVPVHTQERIYQYNRVTSYYLQHYNREPSSKEYSAWLSISIKSVQQLQHFMYKGKVKSLDVVMSGDDEEITYADTVRSEEDTVSQAIEKVGNEQLRVQLWDTIDNIVKSDRMSAILRYRFIEKRSLRETGERMGMTIEAVRQCESKALSLLRRNRRVKQLYKDTLS